MRVILSTLMFIMMMTVTVTYAGANVRDYEQRVNDYLQAVEKAKLKVIKFKEAIKSRDPVRIKKETLKIQEDPAAIKELNKESNFIKNKFVKTTDTIQAETIENIKQRVARQYNVKPEDVKIKKFTNPSNEIKAGHDWDVTVSIEGKDIYYEDVKEIVHESYFEAVGGKKAYPHSNAKTFAKEHHVEVTSEHHAEAYEGGKKYVDNPEEYDVKDVERLSKTIEHKSDLDKKNAEKYAEHGEYGKSEVYKHEQARQYTKQYDKHIEPRIKNMHGKVAKTVREGTKILKKIGKYDSKLKRIYTPADADVDLAKLGKHGETVESIIRKGSALVESAQKIKTSSKVARLKEKLKNAKKAVESAEKSADPKKIRKAKRRMKRIQKQLKNEIRSKSKVARLKEKLKNAKKAVESAEKSADPKKIRKAKRRMKRIQKQLKNEIRSNESTDIKSEKISKRGSTKEGGTTKETSTKPSETIKGKIGENVGEYMEGALVMGQAQKAREGIKEGDSEKIKSAFLGEDTAKRSEGGKKYNSDMEKYESAKQEEVLSALTVKLKRMGATKKEIESFRKNYGKDSQKIASIIMAVKARGGKDTSSHRSLSADGKMDDEMSKSVRAIEAAKQTGSYGKVILDIMSMGGVTRGDESKSDLSDINKQSDRVLTETENLVIAKLYIELRDRGASKEEAREALKNYSKDRSGVSKLVAVLKERDPQKAKGSGTHKKGLSADNVDIRKDDDGWLARVEETFKKAANSIKKMLYDEPKKLVVGTVKDLSGEGGSKYNSDMDKYDSAKKEEVMSVLTRKLKRMGATREEIESFRENYGKDRNKIAKIINDVKSRGGKDAIGQKPLDANGKMDDEKKSKIEKYTEEKYKELKGQYNRKREKLLELGATESEAEEALAGKAGSVSKLIKALKKKQQKENEKAVSKEELVKKEPTKVGSNKDKKTPKSIKKPGKEEVPKEDDTVPQKDSVETEVGNKNKENQVQDQGAEKVERNGVNLKMFPWHQHRFSGAAPKGWILEGAHNYDYGGFSLLRHASEINEAQDNPCNGARVTASVSGDFAFSGGKQPSQKEILKDLKRYQVEGSKIVPYTIGAFMGYLLERKVDTGEFDGMATLVKGEERLNFGYRVQTTVYIPKREGCNTDKYIPFVQSETQGALREIHAIMEKLHIVKEGESSSSIPVTEEGKDKPGIKGLLLSSTPSAPWFLGDKVTINAKVSGGKPPYAYHWTGIKGNRNHALFACNELGKHIVTLEVTDANGESKKESIQIIVEVPEFEITGLPSRPVYASTARLRIHVKNGSMENFKPIWIASEPGIEFDPPEGMETTVTFGRVKKIDIWVQIPQPDGRKTLESDQVHAEVIRPKFTLSTDPDKPFVGEEVRAKIESSIKLPEGTIQWYWSSPPSSNRMEYNDPASEIGFTLNDTKPLKLESEARVPHWNDVIGSIKDQIKAQKYNVAISKPKRLDKAPWRWDPKQGKAVELPQAIAVFQNAEVHCKVTPKPKEKLRYQWTVTPKGCTVSAPMSKSTNLNAHETGTYTVSVEVKDKNNVVLGKGSTIFTVTVSQRDLDVAKQKAKDQKKAKALLLKSRKLWKEGKLQQAIAKVAQAQKFASKDKEVAKTLKAMQRQKKELDAKLDKASNLIKKGKLKDAETILSQAAMISDKYKRYKEVSKQLADAKKKAEEKKKQIAKLLKDAKALKDAGKLDEAAVLLTKGAKQFPGSKKIDKLLKEVQKQQKDALSKMAEGQTQWKNGLLGKAILTLKEASKIDPSNKKIAKALKGMQAQKKIMDDALKKADKFIGQKMFEEAGSVLAKARYINKKYPPYVEMVKKLDRAKKKVEEKKKQLAKILKNAKILKDTDKLDEAIEILKKGSKQFPNNKKINKLLKDVQKQQAAEKPKTKKITNIDVVDNGPKKPTTFRFNKSVKLLFLQTYHWNYGRGVTPPGKIGLRHNDGTMYGPWQSHGRPGQGGVPNANWEVNPNIPLKPGVYTVVDSDPKTWSTNAQEGWKGFAVIRTGPLDYPDEKAEGTSGDKVSQIPNNISSLVGSWSFGRSKHYGKPVHEHLCNLTLTDEYVKGIGYKIKSCHPNESYWILEGKLLLFVALDGTITTKFSEVRPNYWEGTYVGSAHSSEGVVHYLRKSDEGEKVKPAKGKSTGKPIETGGKTGSVPHSTINYIGCYKEKGYDRKIVPSLEDRDMNGDTFRSSNMTIDMCTQYCTKKGFSYAALQYARECYCDDSYGSFGKADNCNMNCSGNKKEICGGAWSNSVYALTRKKGVKTVGENPTVSTEVKKAHALMNGNFELGRKAGAWITLGVGSKDLPGWSVERGTIDVVGTDWVSKNGHRSIDLCGTPGCATLTQIIDTQPGKTYALRFDLSGNPHPNSKKKIKTLQVKIANANKTFHFDTTGKNSSNMGWQRKEVTFTASSDKTKILFIAPEEENEIYFGPAIDNVQIVGQAEPEGKAKSEEEIQKRREAAEKAAKEKAEKKAQLAAKMKAIREAAEERRRIQEEKEKKAALAEKIRKIREEAEKRRVGEFHTRPPIPTKIEQTIKAEYGPPPSANTWTHYSIPLTGSNFGVNKKTFRQIMANVSSVRIRTEMHDGQDVGSIDTVHIGNQFSSSFSTGTSGWNAAGDGTMQWVPSGGSPGGYIQISDWASGEWHWAVAPVGWSGNWQRLIGSSIDFYYKTDHPSYSAVVEISSKPQNRLGVTAEPLVIPQGSTATVFISPYPSSSKDMSISVTSSDTKCMTVPKTVLVPAGETKVQTKVNAVKNTGSCDSVITASASGYGESRITLSVKSSKNIRSSGLDTEGIDGIVDIDQTIKNDDVVSIKNPKVNGVALDYCREWAKNCGKPAADAWCQANGYSGSISYVLKNDTPPTRIISTKKICKSSFCDRIVEIKCRHKVADAAVKDRAEAEAKEKEDAFTKAALAKRIKKIRDAAAKKAAFIDKIKLNALIVDESNPVEKWKKAVSVYPGNTIRFIVNVNNPAYKYVWKVSRPGFGTYEKGGTGNYGWGHVFMLKTSQEDNSPGGEVGLGSTTVKVKVYNNNTLIGENSWSFNVKDFGSYRIDDVMPDGDE